MIQIKETLVSEILLEKKFVCNLTACKGACCVQGDSGAPLEDDELEKLEEVYPLVKPFLTQKAIDALEEDLYTIDTDGETVTQLVDGKECAFTYFEKDGTAKCSIEKAHSLGLTAFQKPISCHLFPVRINPLKSFTAVNYSHWDICSDACVLGEELKVKTYVFLKEPLIRKFGNEWYKELELVDEHLNK